MAKSFLKDYTIGKDIIDTVEEENFPAVSEPKEKDAEQPAGGQKTDASVSEEKASKILAEAETLVSTLNYNVNEELAIRAFVLNIVF